MANWWICFGCALPVPAALILSGLMMWKRCPKKINGLVGYRTARSMKTMDAWRFANEFCGRLTFWAGIGSAVLSAAVLLALLRASDAVLVGAMAVLCLLPLVPLFLAIAKTESALKARFPDQP